MALRRRKTAVPPPARALTAATSVIPLGTGSSWETWKFGNSDWQVEAWRLYDVVGELHFLAGRIGDSIARARLYVTEVDDTGEETGEVTDPRISRLAAIPLGTGAQRDDALKLAATDLAVGGECWLVGQGAAANPEATGGTWFVVTSSALGSAGGQVTVRRPRQAGGGKITLVDGVDILLRCWRPHPNDPDQADAPTRSGIVPLREIELLTKREFSELDSRLTGAGVMFLPEGIDFPRREDDPLGIAGFMAYVQRAAAASMQDQGDARSMVPIMATVPTEMLEYLDKIKPINFWSELSGEIAPMKIAAIARFASFSELPSEVLTGMGDLNHWCKPGETEIYTPSGWCSKVEIGDTVLTLDHETGLSRWSPVLDLYRAPVIDEPMLTVELSSGHGGKRFEITATPDHRYPVICDGERIVVRGFQLQTGDVITRGAPAPGPETPVFSDDLVRLVAWYSADGTHTGTDEHPRQIRIGKSWRENPDATARLVSTLTGVFGPARDSMPAGTPPAWRMERQDRGMMIAVLNALARDQILGLVPGKAKVIPRSFVEKLTSAQREIFLSAWLDSDGDEDRMHDSAAGSILQRDPERLDAIEYAAILSGRPVRRWTKQSTAGAFKAGTLYGLSISAIATATVMAVRETTYTGEVWCPVTETGTWLAREPNGWTEYTGNTGWLVTEEGQRWISGYGAPILDALTRGFLQLALKAMGVQNPERYAYAFDYSRLAAKPNRLDDALKLRELNLISDEETVKAGAFDPEQMPSTEDRAVQIVIDAVKALPSLLGDPAVQKMLGLPEISTAAPAAIASEPTEEPDDGNEGPPEDDGEGDGDPSGAQAVTAALNARLALAAAKPLPVPSAQAIFNASAKLMVFRALELAGNRLTTPAERNGRWREVARHELNARVGPITPDKADKILYGAWNHVGDVAADLGVDPVDLERLLSGYVTELLTRGMAHHDDLLFAALQIANRGRGLVTA